MPIAASVTGTLTKVAAGGSAAAGTLSVIGYSTGGATGTLDVDRTLFLAFYARVRLTRPDVYLDEELMANLVDSVSLESSLGDPIDYATFTLSDKRVAFFDAATVSNGERAVDIDFWAGPPGAVLKWDAFTGTTETSQNTMPYRPRGTFRSVSLAAKWANNIGCLNVPAFSELTRGEILAAFAESAGVFISNAITSGGGIVRKPIDIAGKTPFELVQEFGEIEGWFARTTIDGTALELISEDQMLAGAPVFAFDESNTFDVPETCPNRPVTDWILSATQAAIPASDGAPVVTLVESDGIDENGDPTKLRTKITTQYGVEVERVTEQWATVITPGVDLSAAKFQITNRVTIVNTWTPFNYVDASGVTQQMLSTLLSARVTRTEELTGIPYAVANTDGHDWIQGGRFNTTRATLILTETITEAFTWNADCSPSTTSRTVQRYYAPLGDPAASDVFIYPDGSYRYGATARYLWTTVETQFTNWNGRTDGRTTLSKYFPAGKAATPWDAFDIEAFKVVSMTADLPTQPTSGNAAQPQFTQQVLVAEFDATDASGYAKFTQAPGIVAMAESVDELNAIARRRIRRALSDTLDIPHNCVPYLRVGDHVSVTNHARSLIDADAYVTAIKRTAAVLNGAMRQTTSVSIPPSWI